jgi:hypothetical protein
MTSTEDCRFPDCGDAGGSPTDPDRVVGTATAATNYFRQLGATLGSSVVGSLFGARLSTLMTERLSPDQLALLGDPESLTPKGLGALPDSLKDPVIASYNNALAPVYLWIAPLVLLATTLLLFLSDNPLAAQLDRDLLPDRRPGRVVPAALSGQ